MSEAQIKMNFFAGKHLGTINQTCMVEFKPEWGPVHFIIMPSGGGGGASSYNGSGEAGTPGEMVMVGPFNITGHIAFIVNPGGNGAAPGINDGIGSDGGDILIVAGNRLLAKASGGKGGAAGPANEEGGRYFGGGGGSTGCVIIMQVTATASDDGFEYPFEIITSDTPHVALTAEEFTTLIETHKPKSQEQTVVPLLQSRQVRRAASKKNRKGERK